ncbi:MAG TPA: metal ABC transporter permease, partial [Xanthobacteraceae bacterium]|nr:metal ABC transporter permease [Xanthobacteraceae bacterium]
MSDFQRPAHVLKREVTADSGAMLRTLVQLWPYIWPANRRDLKDRVIFATVLLFVAKLATVAVPFTFKWATDALAGHGTAPLGPDDVIAWALATPVMMTLAYGGMRILMAALTQLRDGIFAKVAMNAVRRLA